MLGEAGLRCIQEQAVEQLVHCSNPLASQPVLGEAGLRGGHSKGKASKAQQLARWGGQRKHCSRALPLARMAAAALRQRQCGGSGSGGRTHTLLPGGKSDLLSQQRKALT